MDMFTPAVERGLPLTRIISRMSLQQILARAVGEDVILNDSNVVDFEDDGTKVNFTTEAFEMISSPTSFKLILLIVYWRHLTFLIMSFLLPIEGCCHSWEWTAF